LIGSSNFVQHTGRTVVDRAALGIGNTARGPENVVPAILAASRRARRWAEVADLFRNVFGVHSAG